MLKNLSILFTILVICSHSILFTFCVEDEFAEFDDFVPTETKPNDAIDPVVGVPTLQKQPQPKPDHQSYQQKQASNNQESTQANVEQSEQRSNDDDQFKQDHIANEAANESRERSQKKPDLKLVNAPLPKIYGWESYYLEIAFLIASFLYFVNYFIGSSTNQKLTRQWYEQTREILKQQFALVGGAPHLGDSSKKRNEEGETDFVAMKKQKGLIKYNESVYTLWNSGRVGLEGLLVEINLLKRQDLFSMALNLLKPSKDNLILRFLLNQEGYENFVFCLAHKSHAPKLVRGMVDINTFCPKRKPISQFGVDIERLFVMSELSDVASFILDQKTALFLRKYEKSINFIHITDQFSIIRSEEVLPAQRLANSKRMATFSFTLPLNATDRTEFILFALSLLDRLRRFKLAKDSKQKSEKNRQKITDIIQKTAFSQRQEAVQAKKEELRRLEKERIYNEDDPEKQKRWEKKEAKRELKKNKTRMKQFKVKSM